MSYCMVLDIKKCIGCYACSVVCKQANGTPPGVNRSSISIEHEGSYPDTKAIITPRVCMHCENAPCVEVCPSGASAVGEDGIVTIDKETCIGCKSCIMACPYGARSYIASSEGYFGETLNAYEGAKYAVMPEGTVDKCDFCKGNGRLEAGDSPACVAACVAGARYFGTFEEMKEIIDVRGGYQLLPEEGTNPSVYYVN